MPPLSLLLAGEVGEVTAIDGGLELPSLTLLLAGEVGGVTGIDGGLKVPALSLWAVEDVGGASLIWESVEALANAGGMLGVACSGKTEMIAGSSMRQSEDWSLGRRTFGKKQTGTADVDRFNEYLLLSAGVGGMTSSASSGA